MNIGLLTDSHNFVNLAIMKLSRYHKDLGDSVEWAMPMFGQYDILYNSKVFTFSPEPNWNEYNYRTLVQGGTGYDIKKELPPPVEAIRNPDYSIYPSCNYSIQFYSRGCIRNCGYCLVRRKEGRIHPVEPMELNPRGEWIEVLDNNFFANPEWKFAVEHLEAQKQPIKFHGVDVRIMTEEHAYWLNRLKLKTGVHIAWDDPKIDLTEKLRDVTKYLKPYKMTCYVLVGFDSTLEQDLFRLNTLKSFGILPFVQPFRDYENRRQPSAYEKDLARWANRAWLFKSSSFEDFEPRKGFRCKEYLK